VVHQQTVVLSLISASLRLAIDGLYRTNFFNADLDPSSPDLSILYGIMNWYDLECLGVFLSYGLDIPSTIKILYRMKVCLIERNPTLPNLILRKLDAAMVGAVVSALSFLFFLPLLVSAGEVVAEDALVSTLSFSFPFSWESVMMLVEWTAQGL